MEHNVYNGAIRRQISKSIKTTHFCARITISDILTFAICDIKYYGQGRGVQHSQ